LLLARPCKLFREEEYEYIFTRSYNTHALHARRTWLNFYHFFAENVVAQDVPFPRRSVLLVSQATGNLSDFAEVSARINAAYARRHGYGFVVARGDASDWVQDR
jgi:hypothetical protein